MPSQLHQSLAAAADRLLDPTVLFSFDQTGFRRHAVNFDPTHLDVDLTGRVALVTGANSGLGKETARELARRGAQVWLLCRNQERGQAALDELAQDTGGDLHLAIVDLADLDSVRQAVQALPVPQVHILVLNAGLLVHKRQLSPQGHELTLAVHLVGHFLLATLLLPLLTAAGNQGPAARIVWVSSGGMYPRKLSLDRLAATTGSFDGVKAYADVKRAQVVLSELMAQRLAGQPIHCNAMHPGWAATPGVARSIPTFEKVTRRILRTPAEGADTIVWLAASPAVEGESGRFWFDRRAVSAHWRKGTRASAAEREALWSQSLLWAGVEPDRW